MANTGTQYLPGGGAGKVPQFLGLYAGYVSANVDPLGQNRCKLRVPQVLGNASTGWAFPLIAPASTPAIGAQVVVAFIGGDLTQPAYLGPLG